MKVSACGLVISMAVAAWFGVVHAHESDPSSSPGDYYVGPEDVLDISVRNNEELSRVVPVRPDGRISLPLVNEVHAAGLTPLQLQTELARRFAAFISNAEVSVIVREVHSIKVSVLGQVRTPGRFELKSRATVLDVLALGQGFTDFAARHRIVILRWSDGSVRRIRFDYDEMVSNGGNGADLFVHPGDIVVVP